MLLLISEWMILIFILLGLMIVVKRFYLDQKKLEDFLKDQSCHIQVIGPQGTGKTMFLVSLIEQMTKKEYDHSDFKFALSYLPNAVEKGMREISEFKNEVNKRYTEDIVISERQLFQDSSLSTPTKKPEDFFFYLEYRSNQINTHKRMICKITDIPGSYFESEQKQNQYFSDLYQHLNAMIFIINANDLALDKISQPIDFYREYRELIQKQYLEKPIPISFALTKVDQLEEEKYQALQSHESELFQDWFKHLSLSHFKSNLIYSSANPSNISYENIKNAGYHLFSQMIENFETSYQDLEQSVKNIYKQSLILLGAILIVSFIFVNVLVMSDIHHKMNEISNFALQENTIKDASQSIDAYFSTWVLYPSKQLINIDEEAKQTLERLKQKEIKATSQGVLAIDIFGLENQYLDELKNVEKHLSMLQEIEDLFKHFEISLMDQNGQKILDDIRLLRQFKKEAYQMLGESLNLQDRGFLDLQTQFADQTQRLSQLKKFLVEYPIHQESNRIHLEDIYIDLLSRSLQKTISFNNREIGLNDDDFLRAHQNLTNFHELISLKTSNGEQNPNDKVGQLRQTYQNIKSQIWAKRWAFFIDVKSKKDGNQLYVYEVAKNLKQFQDKVNQNHLPFDPSIQNHMKVVSDELLEKYNPYAFEGYLTEKQEFETFLLPWLKQISGQAEGLGSELKDFEYQLRMFVLNDIPKTCRPQCDLEQLLKPFDEKILAYHGKVKTDLLLSKRLEEIEAKLKSVRDLFSQVHEIEIHAHCDKSKIQENKEDHLSGYDDDWLDAFSPAIGLFFYTQKQYFYEIISFSQSHGKYQIATKAKIKFQPFEQLRVHFSDVDDVVDIQNSKIVEDDDDVLVATNGYKYSSLFNQPNDPAVFLSLYALSNYRFDGQDQACQFQINVKKDPWIEDIFKSSTSK